MNVPELYGSRVFNDDVMRQKLPKDVYKSLTNTIATGGVIDPAIAGTVASAMKDWAIEKGATHFTHWFQPLSGVTAEKHDAFISPLGDKVIMEFSGKELIKGESDASSFPSGGLRATFEARGYTAWDPASYAFVKDGTLYIPTAFCSYTGEALDTKTPLLRSMDALNTQGLRILRLFGDNTTTRVCATVGAEQEYFLVNKKYFDRRKDLSYCGRTLFGAPAPKGQEMEDHYFGPLKTAVSAFMSELDRELWALGINAKTKHNEAAPSQHELAPIYTTANVAVDQNMLTMEYMKKVAERHSLVCLLHEKPYAGVSGSGKHNNWALATDTGKNLTDPGKKPGENMQFLLILAAVLQAVDDYQGLLRLSIATAGNDSRLGADEAPPAIISIFVGEELERIIKSIIHGQSYAGANRATMNLGVPSIPTFRRDTTDRNRTSPFAFTGKKFEFRMPGAAQNIAMPNIVLNTAVAKSFCEYADRLENAADFDAELHDLLREVFTKHERILFSGNGYSREWEIEAENRGLCNYRRSVDVYPHMTDEENVALFEKFGVMNRTELTSRQDILLENYAKIINIEAQTMIVMASREYIPAVEEYMCRLATTANQKKEVLGPGSIGVEKDVLSKLSTYNEQAYAALEALKKADKDAIAQGDHLAVARAFADRVVPAMQALRAPVDAMETLMPSALWPVPTYGEMTYKQ
ncbi:MAG: glutamine synthetase III [Clostridia bacterium]|nr:glutamine synthetase III [Clostridia bacterium]